MVSKIECNPNVKPYGCSLHKYSKGDSFTKHIDLNANFPDRRWNLGIQLNENYTGGEYVCYDENNNEIILSKEVGTAIAYNSTTLHEIREIHSGERWSIVAPIWKNWLLEKRNLL
jgi:predicted 2-oxoglutarate/Fe(II)-dependent dioxygenase YbiX